MLNEFVAFSILTGQYQPGMEAGMSKHAYVLASFALTGFANFASIGIQLGGIGAMAPNRRIDAKCTSKYVAAARIARETSHVSFVTISSSGIRMFAGSL